MIRRPPGSKRTDTLFPYPTLFRSTTSQSGTSIRAKVLVCTGADDPAVPVEQRNAFEDEMRLGGVDWRMHVYGGVVHSFTNKEADAMGQPQFLRYDAGADARSWQEMSEFFAEIFRSEERSVGKECVGTFRSRGAATL